MNNFAVLNIAYLHFTNSILIRNTTNNPCHLTCYYTDKEPGSHRTSRNQRGLTLPWGVYYCFVAWQSVEQIEPGDTLTHTFVIPDWLISQVRWFAFRGTVSGVLSPSVSCIFKHKHTGQTLILNPSFEDWSPTIFRPLYWYYPWQSPLPKVYFPDSAIKVHGAVSARAESPTEGWYGAIALAQLPPVANLSNLPLTFKVAYRGKASWWNYLRIRAKGDTDISSYARPTLDYQWEDLEAPITLPANLYELLVHCQHNYQPADPFPYKSWWDNVQVEYTP